MAVKKPSILEGEIARALGRADKLKIVNVKGGAGYWVPDDTVQTMSKRINKNGTYKAKDDGKYGYYEVIVNVPGNRVVGEGPDGNDHAISEVLDEDGNPTGDLRDDLVPSSMRIVRPPYRTDYTDGETISFDGIACVLYLKNGQVFTNDEYPNGVVPFDELVFPVTKAESEGSGIGHMSDGNGLNAIRVSYVESQGHGFNSYYQRETEWTSICGTTPLGIWASDPDVNGLQATVGSWADEDIGKSLLLTRYDNGLYAASAGGYAHCDGFAYLNGTQGAQSFGLRDGYGWRINLTSSRVSGTNVFVKQTWGFNDLTSVPLSTVDPTGRNIEDLHDTGSSGLVPVQWINNTSFSDSFEINVTGSSSSIETGSGGGNF